MKRSFGAIVITSMLVVPAAAQIVVDHQPTRRGGPAADTDFINIFGQHAWQLVADDFALSAPATIRRASVWGFYDLDNPPDGEIMRIRFYEARPGDGLPGNILYQQAFSSFSRDPTGWTVLAHDGVREFLYTFDLPTSVALAAATPYWFEVVQLGDVSTHWRIEFSGAAAERSAYLNPFVSDWTASTSNMAFQLSTVPEPSGFLLSAFILAAIAGRWRSAGRLGDRINSKNRLSVLVLAVLACFVAPAKGQIVVDHQPTRRGGPAADTDFIDMFGRELWNLDADDFLLSTPSEIRRVSAWGFYDLDNPPAMETMRLRFYEARPGDGLPGNILYEQEFSSFSRVPTGWTVLVHDGVREFLYTFDLPTPVVLAANTPYWFEVVQLGDIDTHWRIEASGLLTENFAFLNPLVTDWTISDSNLAFKLLTVPEPASIVFLAITTVFAIAVRRRSAGRLGGRMSSHQSEASSWLQEARSYDSS